MTYRQIVQLAHEIASIVPALAQDSPINNANLIAVMIAEADLQSGVPLSVPPLEPLGPDASPAATDQSQPDRSQD